MHKLLQFKHHFLSLALLCTMSVFGQFFISINISHAAQNTQIDPAAKHPYGYWIGSFIVDQGTSCPSGDVALMQVTKKEMIFVPRTGPLVLRGKPQKKTQHYHAELLKTDLNKDPFPIVFEAVPQGDHFLGTYGSPTCRAHLILTKTKMW